MIPEIPFDLGDGFAHYILIRLAEQYGPLTFSLKTERTHDRVSLLVNNIDETITLMLPEHKPGEATMVLPQVEGEQ